MDKIVTGAIIGLGLLVLFGAGQASAASVQQEINEVIGNLDYDDYHDYNGSAVNEYDDYNGSAVNDYKDDKNIANSTELSHRRKQQITEIIKQLSDYESSKAHNDHVWTSNNLPFPIDTKDVLEQEDFLRRAMDTPVDFNKEEKIIKEFSHWPWHIGLTEKPFMIKPISFEYPMSDQSKSDPIREMRTTLAIAKFGKLLALLFTLCCAAIVIALRRCRKTPNSEPPPYVGLVNESPA